ncbi:MAG TPA: Holliday junction resolvase RuvX [Candidatus Saccharimonadales bacterium]|nr:Holliday junction resolvase RuvX [Candidatus Saccharimonadales bacterium]
MQTSVATFLALDVGAQRIGVARANSIARIASPLTTLQHTDQVLSDIAQLVKQEQADELVVGLPRGLESQETDQTRYVRQFVADLQTHITIPIHFQDEALTSVTAKKELEARKKPYAKGEVDALAATYILNDYLGQKGAF